MRFWLRRLGLLRSYGVKCDCLTVPTDLPRVPGPQMSEHMARLPTCVLRAYCISSKQSDLTEDLN